MCGGDSAPPESRLQIFFWGFAPDFGTQPRLLEGHRPSAHQAAQPLAASHRPFPGLVQQRTKSKIGILISGRGSNMIALADAVDEGRVPNAEISVVISDKPDAAGLRLARQRGLNTLTIERRGRTREEHDREIVAALKECEVDFICLAGYMRLLTPYFINAYPNHILNIHPSLLPAFPGLEAQKQALEQGVESTGCTVHFVDETLDGGPVIVQKRVPVLNGDTEESLSARILEQEHQLYPEALALVVSGKFEIAASRVLRKP
jgi:phosphoribosylglycinamide formyltransferase 1